MRDYSTSVVAKGERFGRPIHPQLGRAYPKLVGSPGGVFVRDDEGRTLLDAAAGVGVLCLGYRVPEIVRAMTAQAESLPYAHSLRFASDPAERLSAELVSVTPTGFDWFSFTSGGSEAVEAAMKIARQYHIENGERSRFRFIGRWQSFHGNTIATQSVGGHIGRRQRHLPLLIDFPHIETPDCLRCGNDADHAKCVARHKAELRLTIERWGPDTIAGLVTEIVSGASSGARTAPAGYYQAMREVCDEYGILIIADEVYTALGRTGDNFASDAYGVDPDIIVMGKGMSGGFAPMGGVAVHNRMIDVFLANSGVLEHNFTFAAHPISCAASVATLQLLKERSIVSHVAEVAAHLRRGLEPLLELPVVGDIRGKGLMVGIEFVRDKQTLLPLDPSLGFAAKVAGHCYERDLIVYPGSGTVDGLVGDHLLLTPPLVIERSEVDQLVDRLVEGVRAACSSQMRA